MLRCRPRPKETIVTMTATPTRTPIVVSVARSLACRRLRRAKLRMSIKLISKCQAGTAGVLACFVTTHLTNKHLAGGDACGPSTALPEPALCEHKPDRIGCPVSKTLSNNVGPNRSQRVFTYCVGYSQRPHAHRACRFDAGWRIFDCQ